jgi:hypothetical protein
MKDTPRSSRRRAGSQPHSPVAVIVSTMGPAAAMDLK